MQAGHFRPHPRGTPPTLEWVPSTYPLHLNLLKRFVVYGNTPMQNKKGKSKILFLKILKIRGKIKKLV